jgi:hypothetical protein
MDGVSTPAIAFIFPVLILGYASMGSAIWTVGLIVLVLNGTRRLIRFLIIDQAVLGTWLIFEMQLY